MIVCAPLVASYWTVPAQLLPVVNGVEDRSCVLIVPELVTLVTPKSYVTILNMPLAVVFKVVAVMSPLSVSVPLVLFKFKLPYVPAMIVCAPVVASYWPVPAQVLPVVNGVEDRSCVLIVPE